MGLLAYPPAAAEGAEERPFGILFGAYDGLDVLALRQVEGGDLVCHLADAQRR
jgi:hypothetical protein